MQKQNVRYGRQVVVAGRRPPALGEPTLGVTPMSIARSTYPRDFQ